MPYLFTGVTSRDYVQYKDTETWKMLQAQPGGTYDMVPVPGAGDLSVPPGDGLWAAVEDSSEEPAEPAEESGAEAAPDVDATPETSAPPGADDQARETGRNSKPAADAAPEGQS